MANEAAGTSPVRVWGELSTTYRVRERGDDDSRNTNWLRTGTIAASSYIWRPWFALANGSLSLSTDESEAPGQPSTEDQFTTGDGQFSLFPTSRFPFRAYFIESRDEFDSESFSRNIRTTEYGMEQRYRTLDGKHNYAADYQNRRQEQADFDEFLSSSLLLTSNNRLGNNSIESDLKLDTVDNTTRNEQATSYSVTLDHGYDADANLTVDNLLSTSNSESDLIDSSSETETAQLSSFLTWHPDNRKDIRLTGSLRVAETRMLEQRLAPSQIGFVDNETANANLNQGLIYEYSRQLQFSQSVNASYVETDGQPLFTASESVAARYTPDRVKTGWGDYGWTASSRYSNLHGDVEREHSVDTRFNQSLINDYSKKDAYQLRTNLTQSLSYEFESDDADEKDIDHSYSVTWSNGANRNQNLVRFFVSDSRSLNRDNDYFQLLNFQYTGSTRLDRYSQLSGNITLQRSEQKQAGERSSQQINNGNIEYRHNRIFQVVGLTFASELQLSKRQSEAERLIQQQDPDTEFSWENSLQYRVGRLEVELNLDFVRSGDDYDQLFKFQLTRTFGDL